MSVTMTPPVTWSLALLALPLIVPLAKKLSKMYFVWMMTTTDVSYAHRWKLSLFGCMETRKTIVEIGAGGGGNFLYYPAGCEVICVEPCREIHPHLQRRIDRYGYHLAKVTVLGCWAEDLTGEVAESSVDYVVCTYTLCSVSDVARVLAEVRRILKPGGKFLYLEHTLSSQLMMKLYQEMITLVAKLLLHGCHYNRRPEREVQRSGLFMDSTHSLSTVTSMSWYRPERMQVWGTAVK